MRGLGKERRDEVAKGERKGSVPSDLPPCPAAAHELGDLAVEPILDILADRL